MRSKGLQSWIDERKTPDNIKADLINLPEALRQELLAEALKDWEIRESYDSSEGVLDRRARELIALSSFCARPEILGPVPLRLDGLNDGNAPSSNILDTSALFCVFSNKRSGLSRPVLRNVVVASRETTKIVYCGQELYQFDWDVLHCLLCFSKDCFNGICVVKPIDVLKKIGLRPTGPAYDALWESLRRLFEASLWVENTPKTGKNRFVLGKPTGKSQRMSFLGVRLIDSLYWNRGQELSFSLDSRLIKLYGNHEYGLVDWERRRSLGRNELAKKLQCLFAGQQSNQQFHRVDKIISICGVSSSAKRFIQSLTAALQALIKNGIICAYWISRPARGDGANRVLCIWQKKAPEATEAIFQKPGSYFDGCGSVGETPQNTPKTDETPFALE